jgi:predicted TIM-barrel fold metal-dependent hydrolase
MGAFVAIVDIHCHTFNADDLPVRGFVRSVGKQDGVLGSKLATLVDLVLQHGAPGYEDEKQRLDRLVAGRQLEAEFEISAAPPAAAGVDLERQVDETLHELETTHLALLQEVGSELQALEGDGQAAATSGLEGVGDWYENAKRAVRWATLFTKYRVELTELLARNFDDMVDLYTPLLVDLEMGLHDRAHTTNRQQMELHEKISRLSMRGDLPGVQRRRIHPFMSFDPRRELRSRLSEDEEKPLDLVKQAVERYGFVGVKVYPPMGWKPLGNEKTIGMPERAAHDIDDILVELYSWCEKADVPITAHCNRSNEAAAAFADFASPDNWALVLERFPDLRLNLGHFGGGHKQDPQEGWAWKIARLATPYPHVFADVGNHRVDATGFADYLQMLDEMFAGRETCEMQQRLMFGSDWFMLALLPAHDQFLANYRAAYEERFGKDALDEFLGAAALSFLGFDDPTNKNAVRLLNRYRTIAPNRIPGWLSHQDDRPPNAERIELGR